MNLDQIRIKMNKVLEVIHSDLATVRTGRATPSLVENIVINAYAGPPAGGTKLRVLELAHVTVSDPQTLILTPFDPSIIQEIQKGILEANVGLTPEISGQIIRITIPQLSQERREELIHLVNQKLEAGRIQVRQVRHEAMNEIKKQFEKKSISEDDMVRLEKEAQRITDEVITEIDTLGKRKEEELLQI